MRCLGHLEHVGKFGIAGVKVDICRQTLTFVMFDFFEIFVSVTKWERCLLASAWERKVDCRKHCRSDDILPSIRYIYSQVDLVDLCCTIEMNEKTLGAVMMGVFIPIIMLCLVLIGFSFYRRYRNQRQQSYRYDELNNDNMDEDEIEFKRMLESSHGSSDYDDNEDIEAMFGEDSNHEDVSFSSKEKDRLMLLEKLRSNLVATAESKSDDTMETSPNQRSSPSFDRDSDDEENMRL